MQIDTANLYAGSLLAALLIVAALAFGVWTAAMIALGAWLQHRKQLHASPAPLLDALHALFQQKRGAAAAAGEDGTTRIGPQGRHAKPEKERAKV